MNPYHRWSGYFAVLGGFLTLALQVSPSYGYAVSDYYRVTREEPVVLALSALDQSTSRATVQYILDHSVRIVFKDMRQLGKGYRDHDAVSWLDPEGHQYVFIHEKHRSAPPQALAALLSHEVMHNDQWNSTTEELAGWTQECRTWQEMLHRYPELQQIKTRQFPLVDRLNAIKLLMEQNRLAQTVRSHQAYSHLPHHSPGY